MSHDLLPRAAIAALFVFACFRLPAQQDAGGLVVSVRDPNGAVVQECSRPASLPVHPLIADGSRDAVKPAQLAPCSFHGINILPTKEQW